MSELERIACLAETLCRRHGSRNPFTIAKGEGIHVVSCPDFQSLKGMYKVILGQRYVFLNAKLSRREAKLVLAHELGHDALHREMGENSIVQDAFIMDMTLKPEYEANLFAANLLYEDGKVLSALREGKNAVELTQLLGGSPALAELKILCLKKQGVL